MPNGGKIGDMTRSDRVPLKPDYAAAARRHTGTPLVRAAAAYGESYIKKTLAEDVLAQRCRTMSILS